MSNPPVDNIYARFRDLHREDGTFVMANAWNPGSAVVLAEAGFEAIGTTSAGIAFSHALPDYEGAVSLERALGETAAMVNAVELPVSMDGENGFADAPEGIYDNVLKITGTGVAGLSIEDHPGQEGETLYPSALAVERIQAAGEALATLDHPVMLTARAECYLVGHPEPFAESVKRANLYCEAGADCLFVPGLRDIATISELVQEVEGPVNVVIGLSGPPLSVAELADAGVRRISIGGSLARATFGLVRRAAREILDHGTFGYAAEQIPDAELCRLFSKATDGV